MRRRWKAMFRRAGAGGKGEAERGKLPAGESRAGVVKKVIVAAGGGTLLVVGIGMIVLPGPAFLVIPAALAVLATEFVWARRALRHCEGVAVKARTKFRWRRLKLLLSRG